MFRRRVLSVLKVLTDLLVELGFSGIRVHRVTGRYVILHGWHSVYGEVAIKTLRKYITVGIVKSENGDLESLLREAAFLKTLSHEGIVKFYTLLKLNVKGDPLFSS